MTRGPLFRFSSVVAFCLAISLMPVSAEAQGLERKGNKLYYCGEVIRLVGYGDYGILSESSFDYKTFFNQIKKNGVNMVRVWVVYHWTHDLMPFAGSWKNWDLESYSDAYFARLQNFVAAAHERGIIVQLNFFDSVCLENTSNLRWANCPFNDKNNKQPYCKNASEFDDIDGSPPIWKEVNKPLLEKTVKALNGYNNIIWEVMNEPHTTFGDSAFLSKVIDTLYELLNDPSHTGSRIISLNAGSAALQNSNKVDIVSYHISDPGQANDHGKFPKPVIISNDGDQSQSTKGWNDAERLARTKTILKNTFSDGSPLGHTHFEFLDKDLMGPTWLTTDYNPSTDYISYDVLGVLKSYSETPPKKCGDTPDPEDPDPEDPENPIPNPNCDVGKKIMIDNGQAGYSETTQNWATWNSIGQAIGKDYRYLSKTVGDGSKKGTAKWNPKLPVAGMYKVQATFRATGNRTNDADYFVYDSKGKSKQYVVDQTDGLTGEAGHGPVYADLGTHHFEPGKGYVILDGTDDAKSDEADAVIWTLKSCDGDPGGGDPGGGDPGGGDPGGGDPGGGDPGGTEPQPEICPPAGPGPATQVAYAKTVTTAGGWESLGNAEGKDDGKFAHNPNLDKGESLTGTQFGVCDPDGTEQINSVEVAVKSKVQYDSGKYAVVVKLSVGSVQKTYSHTNNGWDTINITNLKPTWTWAEIKAIKATVSLQSHPGGNNDSDVWVDAFRVTVSYSACTPNIAKTCVNGNVLWVDGCGTPGDAAELCDDQDPCTQDGCEPGGGTCTHTPIQTVECIDAPPPPPPPPVCTPGAKLECWGNALLWVDSCGNPHDIADTCLDDDPCTKDGCDPTLQACVHPPSLVPGCIPCAPNTEKQCVGGHVLWVDSCGNLGDIVESCDDHNPCTLDACDHGTATCIHAPNESNPACKDCAPKVAKACVNSSLVWVDACGNPGEVAQDCDDGDPCTLDLCDSLALTCLHQAVASPGCIECTPKVDQQCLGDAVLWLDSCGNVSDIAAPCNDGDPCTLDACDPETLVCTHIPSGAPECAPCPPMAQKKCVGGAVMWSDGCGNLTSMVEDCNDNNPCTIDLCNPAIGACQHLPSTSAACQPCVPTEKTVCVGGMIVSVDSCGNISGVVESCNDGVNCTLDLCNSKTLQCEHIPTNNLGCKACTPKVKSVCSGNVLLWVDSCGNTGGLAGSCDDGDACTLDICDTNTDTCTHLPNPNEECLPCQPSSTKVCLNGAVVTLDSCGQETAVVDSCDDGNPCTLDGCDSVKSLCYHIPISGEDCPGCGPPVNKLCFQQNVVGVDACGQITETYLACSDDDPCTSDLCDPSVVSCAYKNKPDGECQECVGATSTQCDGIDIVWVDSCGQPGDIAMSCDDGNPCTADSCDPTSSLCVHVALGTPGCEPEEPCVSAPFVQCDGTNLVWIDPCGQQAGIAEICTDFDPCTDDFCSTTTGVCEHSVKDDPECKEELDPGSECLKAVFLECEGNAMVWIDACGEKAGLAAVCEDGDECTVGTCDSATLTCMYSPSESKECAGFPAADAGSTDDALEWLDVGEESEDSGSSNEDSGQGTGGIPLGDGAVAGDLDVVADSLESGGSSGGGGGDGGCAASAHRKGGPWTGGIWWIGLIGVVWTMYRRSKTKGATMKSGQWSVWLVWVVFGAVLYGSPAAAAPACSSPGPGVQTITKYAQNCTESATNGWNYEVNAEGAPDGKFAETPNLDAGEELVCTGFNVCDPSGNEIIQTVKIGVYSKTQYDSGDYQVNVKLTVGSQTKTYSHKTLSWDEIDVTAQKASWTWDDIIAMKAKVSLGNHPKGNNDSDVWVDAFRVVVTYNGCAANASKQCIGNAAYWYDSCGAQGGLAQNCDDGNGCTVDSCNAGNCSNTPTANTGTTCVNGHVFWTNSCGAVGGLKENCDDGQPCTADGCNSGQCFHNPTPNAYKQCVGGTIFWFNSCGTQGNLVEGCDDNNACTDDVCTPGGCIHSKKIVPECCGPYVGTICENNSLYQKDSCGLKGPLIKNCADNNACTIDSCDPIGGTCSNIHDNVLCPPDCNPKTTKCLNNNLVSVDNCGNITVLEVCDDKKECTVDSCDSAKLQCVHVPSSEPQCVCNQGEKLGCQGNALVKLDLCDNLIDVLDDCNDGDACTIDICDAQAGECKIVINEGPPCKCTKITKTCKGNALFWVDDCGNSGELADACKDDDECTIDGCDATTAQCSYTPSNAPECVCNQTSVVCQGNALVLVDNCSNLLDVVENCDDGDECTIDTCNAAAELCEHQPSGTCCDPPDFAKTCQGNAVVAIDQCGNTTGVIEECDDGDDCTIDSCSLELAACQYTPLGTFPCCEGPGETLCKDGQLFTTDSCGAVIALADDCNDMDPCTDDGCVDTECTHAASLDPECAPCFPFASTGCEGGNVVWFNSCGGIEGVAVSCDDGNPCSVDGCDGKTNKCVHIGLDTPECEGQSKPENCTGTPTTACLDQAMVSLDACGNVVSMDSSCLDGDPCTINGCDPDGQTCVTAPAPASSGCDGSCGEPWTPSCSGTHIVWLDSCGLPTGSTQPCDDGDPCTLDTCDPAAVVCVYSPIVECDPDVVEQPDTSEADGGAVEDGGADDASTGGDSGIGGDTIAQNDAVGPDAGGDSGTNPKDGWGGKDSGSGGSVDVPWIGPGDDKDTASVGAMDMGSGDALDQFASFSGNDGGCSAGNQGGAPLPWWWAGGVLVCVWAYLRRSRKELVKKS